MRCPVAVKNERRVLCVFPVYSPAFGTFQHAYKLMYRVKAFMPPQGLLLIAAYMPDSGPVRAGARCETLGLVMDGLRAIDRCRDALVARFQLQREELRVMARLVQIAAVEP